MGKKIGIIFSYNENWIGGTYYILNLINALKSLPLEEQPPLLLIYRDEKDKEQIEKLAYPKIDYYCWELHYTNNQMRINNLFQKVLGFKPFVKELRDEEIAHLFPLNFQNHHIHAFSRLSKRKFIYWVPDLQEKFLPQFFNEKELASRDAGMKEIQQMTESGLVFSSQSAQKDYDTFYPNHISKKKVLNFAVTNQFEYQLDQANAILLKYGLERGTFFLSPNQFWIHKNHQVLLEAVRQLNEQGKVVTVVFTGKEHDPRAPHYAQELKDFANKHGLKQVKFLGFINRLDMLYLMQDAKAVIQPSLFEGWSTVIEDAKSLGKKVIASSLDVHKEQLGDTAVYFDPYQPTDLAHILEEFESRQTEQINYHYAENIKSFAQSFCNIALDNLSL